MSIRNDSGFSLARTQLDPEKATPAYGFPPTRTGEDGSSEKSAPENGISTNMPPVKGPEEVLGDVVSALGNNYEKSLPPLPSSNKPLPLLPGMGDAFGRYGAPSRIAPHINIHGTPEFHHETDVALGKIMQASSGKRLIDELQGPAKKGNSVTISQTTTDQISASPRLNAKQAKRYPELGYVEAAAKAEKLAQKRRFGLKGEGSGAQVTWNPRLALELDDKGRPKNKPVDNPDESHLALAHELIHARRFVKGTSTADGGDRYTSSAGAGKEELRATGIGSRGNRRRISENSIRRELGFPLRTQYKPLAAVAPQEEEHPALPMGFRRDTKSSEG